MIVRGARGRSGITLTEILISILILGVGVIALATLFPLGLIRLRNAQRMTRGAYLVESAFADMGTRNLLAQSSFYGNYAVSPWYFTANTPASAYNPWVQDTVSYGGGTTNGAFRPVGPGLPVAYDPLWRCVTGIYPDNINGTTSTSGTPPLSGESRFGSGVGWIRTDPNPTGTPPVSTPSAGGAQRITNLQSSANLQAIPMQSIASSSALFKQNTHSVLETFVSPEDIVLQTSNGFYTYPAGGTVANPSPVVPDLNMGGNSLTNDWRYTWFFTGQQSDATNGSVFDGDIVICENRPFGLTDMSSSAPFPANAPGSTVLQADGETVVEAVWGWSSSSDPTTLNQGLGANVGYAGQSARRTALLRWPASVPDPAVKVGSWIADVTYERNAPVASARFPLIYPAQRIYWYQVNKVSDTTADPGFTNDPANTSYRQVVVTLGSPVRAMTLLDFSTTPPQPFHVEAALIMPSVVFVYPRTIYTR